MAFLKIDKELIDLWLGKDNDKLVWWIDMLTMAGWDGQFTASLSFLCFRWNTGRKRVENFLSYLEENGRIRKSVENKVTVYTITEGTNLGTNLGTNRGTDRGTYEVSSQSDSYDVPGTNQGANQGANLGTNRGTTINKNIRYNNISTTTPASARVREDETDWMAVFNQMMDEQGAVIPRIKTLIGKRKAALNARIHDFGADAVREVIEKAAKSPFLNGRGNSVFVASFDWLVRPNNFPKVLEGNYDEMFNQQQNNGYGSKYNRGYNPEDDAAARREQDARALISRLLSEGK